MTKKKNRDQKPSLKVKDISPKADPQGGFTRAWPTKVTGPALATDTQVKK